VLPVDIRIYAVGGVGADDFAAYAAAGVYGFGLGSRLFKPGANPGAVRAAAEACMAAISR
ncbi:MAG: 2-dehydro-3-deoxy-6-phosphogalactonate aldolase, partial [Pseudomonadota bacterium]|nr:2-dehydro-3-deoxy-6-phosphogalactonate aldolase [Pseudomonadota bacterium]